MLRSLTPWKERHLLPKVRFPWVLNRLEEEMGDLMERMTGHDGGWLGPIDGFMPSVDVGETESEFAVTVDLPGLKPEEVNVEIKEGALWITGCRKEEKEEKGKTFHKVERNHGEFRRVLPLPVSANENEVNATFENGVLKIVVAKTEEAKTKRIPVKS